MNESLTGSGLGAQESRNHTLIYLETKLGPKDSASSSLLPLALVFFDDTHARFPGRGVLLLPGNDPPPPELDCTSPWPQDPLTAGAGRGRRDTEAPQGVQN